ncbi:MAG: phosphotransferase [Solobacterium sp.]|nr:phosphotransferase [Solobacterium sp.]
MSENQNSMPIVTTRKDGSHITIYLNGRISSDNAPEADRLVKEALDGVDSVVFDCSNLEYIASAGLRIILRTKNKIDDVTIIEACADVYDVFEVTGFTEMLEVHKAFKTISVEGCEVIGEGANGVVYRYGDDTIVKLYRNPDAIDEIKRERELARAAFVMGIPTAISYDIVRIKEGNCFGSVFEMLNADSYQNLLIDGTKSVDEIARMSADLLKILHGTKPKKGVLPLRKVGAEERLQQLKDSHALSDEDFDAVYKKIMEIPDDEKVLHGDFHIKNVMIQNGESLLIDMDTLCSGNPVFEFAATYLAYVGFQLVGPGVIPKFLKISNEDAGELYEKILQYYFADRLDELDVIKKKIQFVCYVRMIYFCGIGKHVPEDRREPVKEICWKFVKEELPRIGSLAI